MFVVVGESLIRKGGGGESTSNSGETEHEREMHRERDCDELRDRDFVHKSLQLDDISVFSASLPFISVR